jgi:phosphoribosylglycinamide formyltransferase 1
VTVHLVDEGVDSGPIVLQQAIEVPYTRDRAQLEEEIHRVEHELLPEAIGLIAAGSVRIDPENPRLVHVDVEASE